MASATTPHKTPSSKLHSTRKPRQPPPPPLNPLPSMDSSSSSARFEAYNRLQAAAVAFGEKLPIPEIVAIGGQSDGKSSLIEALLGFRFNVREVEMGTRRPLVLQMVHDPSAPEPRCRFQEEDTEEYGGPMVLTMAIADIIKSRTEALLKKTMTSVSSKPIVLRAEYAHCPNLTIIDTPGFVLKAKKGEPDNTPDEILYMVKSLARPPHRLLLFLQQSSVEWCSSLWLDAIRDIDPAFRRTIIVVSKFDNRLKEFTDRWEVDQYLSASGYLGENTHPFFVALPKDRGTVSNEEFRRQISQVDVDVMHHLHDNVSGGFDEEKFKSFIGFSNLKDYLEAELQKRYKEAAPTTLALLEQRCGDLNIELAHMEFKLQATSDVSQLRRSAMMHTASICSHVGFLIDGAADPAPGRWGKTTEEERSESGIDSWPGVTVSLKPPNASLNLYGGAAFERVMHEFRCAAYSIECPEVSREMVANILLAHAGRGGGGRLTEAAAEIARASARSWLSPLLDTACDRLAFVLRNLFDLAIERNRMHNLQCEKKNGDMDGYVGFHAALRHSFNTFIQHLSKQCKQLVRHHLDSVTSPYSNVCYENSITSVYKLNQMNSSSHFFDLSSSQTVQDDIINADQENIPPKNKPPKNKSQTTPGKASDFKEPPGEGQLTVPETPSPDQPNEAVYWDKKDVGNRMETGAIKRHSRMFNGVRMNSMNQNRNDNIFYGGCDNSGSGSAYSDICSSAALYFARIREVLIERNVPSTLNSSFLVPCQDGLLVAIGLDLFAVNDEKFMDMFIAPCAIDALKSKQQSLHKRQKILQSCLNDFKNIAKGL